MLTLQQALTNKPLSNRLRCINLRRATLRFPRNAISERLLYRIINSSTDLLRLQYVRYIGFLLVAPRLVVAVRNRTMVTVIRKEHPG